MNRRPIPPPANPSKLDMEPRFFKLGDGTWAVRAHGAPPGIGDTIPVRRSDGIVRPVVVTSLVTRGDRLKHEMWVARTEEPAAQLFISAVAEARKELRATGLGTSDPALEEYIKAVDNLIGNLQFILGQK